ncbi:Gfo/Idh/MocA family protein [Paenibacillus daejeonensis]|uniref:Gfo/Idh/MocA family protein n=1 Tax=Paenibacillus daejeonensis TaxID=135193 RepID=UPI0003A05638|nr:Gfo/Idh/MocA family oxidoreductase [Paenibacillus daejeonensis]
MQPLLRIGMIGLDTSRAPAFTRLLHDGRHPHHVAGGRIVAGYPGGSADFDLSISRVEGITAQLREDYGVRIMPTPEEVAEQSDAIIIESCDGRLHLEEFRRIVPYRKPVFIDKPLAVTSSDAREIARLAEVYGVPVMSCSALRSATALTEGLQAIGGVSAVAGMDGYGPLPLETTQPGWFWYGVHTADMLYRAMGRGCRTVTVRAGIDQEFLVGEWEDGRIGTLRGNRMGNDAFGAMLHTATGTQAIDIASHAKPYLADVLEEMLIMFRTGKGSVAIEETIEIIRFLEAANESRSTGHTVNL